MFEARITKTITEDSNSRRAGVLTGNAAPSEAQPRAAHTDHGHGHTTTVTYK